MRFHCQAFFCAKLALWTKGFRLVRRILLPCKFYKLMVFSQTSAMLKSIICLVNITNGAIFGGLSIFLVHQLAVFACFLPPNKYIFVNAFETCGVKTAMIHFSVVQLLLMYRTFYKNLMNCGHFQLNDVWNSRFTRCNIENERKCAHRGN